jgi:predicted dehydrogenase
MGVRHARVLGELSHRFEPVGAYDLRSDRIPLSPWDRLSGEDEAIARAEVVVVATPTHSHAPTVSRALAAGRHVLVEKPLCATAADARALTAAAAASHGRARLFVGHSERFNPVVRALARLLREDTLLALDLLRVGPSRVTEGGVLLNLGVHDFDLAAYLAGSRVTLHGALGGPDFAHVLFHASGAVGHLYVDGTADARRRAIRVATPRWTYEGDLLAHRLVRSPRGARGAAARHAVPLGVEEPLAAQALALADAIDAPAGGAVDWSPESTLLTSPMPELRRGSEIATGRDGLEAVELAEAAGACCASAEKLTLFAGA